MNRYSGVKTRHAMVLQPHNDDAVIAIGGLLRKLVRADWQISYVYMTDSSHGGDTLSTQETVRVRQAEAAQERQLLGVTEYIEMGLEDESLAQLGADERKNVVAQLTVNIQASQPQIIFVPSSGEMHPDHRATHDLALSAIHNLSPQPIVVKYSVWLLPDFYDKPVDPAEQVLLVGIDAESSLKAQLIGCHESQIARRRYDLIAAHLAAYWARLLKADQLIGVELAEVVGLYSLGAWTDLHSELLSNFAPILDITTVRHGHLSDQ